MTSKTFLEVSSKTRTFKRFKSQIYSTFDTQKCPRLKKINKFRDYSQNLLVFFAGNKLYLLSIGYVWPADPVVKLIPAGV